MKFNTKRTFWFYWQEARRYPWAIAIMLIGIVITSVLSLTPPYFYKRFFDALTSGGDVGTIAPHLITFLVIILGLHGLDWIFWRILGVTVAYFEAHVMKNLGNRCFDYLQAHSYNFFNNNFTGSLIKKINRFTRSFEGITDRIYFDLLSLALRIIIIFGVLFWMRPLLGITMLVWTILFIGFNYWFSLYKLPYDIARAEADSKISGALADTIINNINIKLFSAFHYEFERFKAVTGDWCRKIILSWNLGQVMEGIQTLLMILFEFIVFYFAVQFWKEGQLTVGDFVWIQAYIIDLFFKLWSFGRTVRALYENLADAEEMTVVLDQPHEIQDVPGARMLQVFNGKIAFKNVAFSYPQGSDVMQNLNLVVEPGEKVALIGPSGGGKTTITKLLLRLFDIQGGEILIDGQNITQVTQDSLRKAISFVPQDPILFHRTLMENIRYGRRDSSDKEVTTAAKLAQCHDFIMHFPQQYQTYVGERGVKLSGGERQRVAIARAILSSSPILILDEATSSLDSESEMLIQEALANLMKQKTTIVIAHRLSTIMKMDRIVVLQDGKIVEEGTHSDLVSKESGLYKKLWDLQVGGYVGE
ncbi:MAG: ABC transporter ATP-binding protein [Candidatus Peregrinibacteria bacterium]